MAIYQVQAPDGSIIKLEGPEGASDDMVMQQAQALWKPQAAPQQEAAPKVDDNILSAAAKGVARTGLGVLQGAVADPLLGIAKLAAGAVGSKGAQEFLNKEDEAYKSLRKQLGGEGTDVSRMLGTVGSLAIPGAAVGALGKAGNIASKLANPISSIGGKLAPELAAAVGKIGGAGTQGALKGIEQQLTAADFDPAHQENYLGNKLGAGTLGAAAFGAGANKLLSAITPTAGTLGAKLAERGEGTLGQQVQSPLVQKLEGASERFIPFTGQKINNQQMKAVENLKGEFNKKYEDLYHGVSVKPSQETAQIVSNLENKALDRAAIGTPTAHQDADIMKGVANYIKNSVGNIGQKDHYILENGVPKLAKAAPNLKGRDIDAMIKQINVEKDRAYSSGNHELGSQLKAVVEDLKSAIGNQSPEFKNKLNTLNKEYNQFKALKKRLPGGDNSVRNLVASGDLGLAAYNVANQKPAAHIVAPLAALAGVPLAFTNPGKLRAFVKSSKGFVPLSSGEDRYENVKKKGGLSSVDE